MPLAQSHYTGLGTLAAQYNLHNQCGLVWEQRTEPWELVQMLQREMRHWLSFFLASGIYSIWLVMQSSVRRPCLSAVLPTQRRYEEGGKSDD